jgi:hypothetical protein
MIIVVLSKVAKHLFTVRIETVHDYKINLQRFVTPYLGYCCKNEIKKLC